MLTKLFCEGLHHAFKLFYQFFIFNELNILYLNAILNLLALQKPGTAISSISNQYFLRFMYSPRMVLLIGECVMAVLRWCLIKSVISWILILLFYLNFRRLSIGHEIQSLFFLIILEILMCHIGVVNRFLSIIWFISLSGIITFFNKPNN